MHITPKCNALWASGVLDWCLSPHPDGEMTFGAMPALPTDATATLSPYVLRARLLH